MRATSPLRESFRAGGSNEPKIGRIRLTSIRLCNCGRCLPTFCSRNRPTTTQIWSTKNWSTLGRNQTNLNEVGQSWSNSAQRRPQFGRIQPELGRAKPKSSKFGKHLPKLLEIGQVWLDSNPNSVKHRQILDEIGRHLGRVRPIFAKVGQSWSASIQIRPNMARIWSRTV